MWTALSGFRRFLFLSLLLSAQLSLQEGVERRVDESSKAAVKDLRGFRKIRGLLSAANEADGWGESLRLNVQGPEGESEKATIAPSMYFGPLSECYPECVKGVYLYQERYAVCRDYLGIPVHMSECNPTKDSWTGSFIECPKLACNESLFVELIAWKPCPKACTEVTEDGTVVPEKADRTWKCKVNSPAINNVAAKDCRPLVKKLGLTLKRTCPSKPCKEYRMEPTNWGTCDCKTWTRERTNRCRDNEKKKANDPLTTCLNFGLELVDETRKCLPKFKCNSTEPTNKENGLSEDTFNFCKYYNCSTHGTCKDNRCKCKKGFTGNDCQWDKGREGSACFFPSILEGDGTCCKSGIYDYTGHCCPGENSKLQIDKNGDCCLGQLDICGNCNPEEPEFRDIRGTCCKVLDAAGFCCPSGNVDECGVCDGLSLTCNTILSVGFQKEPADYDVDQCRKTLLTLIAKTMRVQASAIEKHEVEQGKFTFKATRVIVSSGLLTRKARGLIKGKSIKAKCGDVVDLTVYRSAKCGNKVCEIGEASADSEYHCPADCTYEIDRCPVGKDRLGRATVCHGHGSCSFRDKAKCECFEGYSGDSCDQCKYGFFHLSPTDSRCLPRQAYINGPNGFGN